MPQAISIARQAIAENRVDEINQLVLAFQGTRLRPIINASGVILHTNLGRSPWPASNAGTAINIEFDLETGTRGNRDASVGRAFAQLCGAEKCIVVNNGAAAVLLALAALVDYGVVVSRGQLVEIGGGFRIPDIMGFAGANLIEVGTTNKTRVSDYANALRTSNADATMVIHQSNFSQHGFCESTPVNELAALDATLIVDAGSGLLDSRCPWLNGPPPSFLGSEPGVKQLIDQGADVVIFSGDKLLGGPQGGFIAGPGELIDRCAAHPLARALRCGTHVLLNFQKLAETYQRNEGQNIPFWRFATTSPQALNERADRIVSSTAAASNAPTLSAVPTHGVPGGGTLPTASIDSFGVSIAGDHSAFLRARPTPIVANVQNGATVIDLLAVEPSDDAQIVDALVALGKTASAQRTSQ